MINLLHIYLITRKEKQQRSCIGVYYTTLTFMSKQELGWEDRAQGMSSFRCSFSQSNCICCLHAGSSCWSCICCHLDFQESAFLIVVRVFTEERRHQGSRTGRSSEEFKSGGPWWQLFMYRWFFKTPFFFSFQNWTSHDLLGSWYLNSYKYIWRMCGLERLWMRTGLCMTFPFWVMFIRIELFPLSSM